MFCAILLMFSSIADLFFPQRKVGLIVSVVRVLGFKCAMQILEDTRKIEKNGGMLTVDGSRR